jgi:hypothetical protein
VDCVVRSHSRVETKIIKKTLTVYTDLLKLKLKLEEISLAY